MQYHIQTIRGSNGDCFRTALACLLDVDKVENVPHFFDGDPAADEGWNAVRKWLSGRSLLLLTMPFSQGLDEILSAMKAQNPGIFYLIVGRSATDHHVVCAYEDNIVHDPGGPGASLVGPCDQGYFWLHFLLPQFHGVAS